MARLTVQQVAKSFKNRKVVKDVSLAVGSHEVVGLLGPNGAGKTTTFYMIVGLIQPDRGEIFLDSTDITHYPMHQRAKMGLGYLPQEMSVFRKMTVANNIMAVLELRRDLNKKQRRAALDQLLEEFSIRHLKDIEAVSLSGGERRRVEIARALAIEPKFILLDEPFAGIDPISVIDIKNIINQLKDRGVGVLITDHNVRETLDICDTAYIVSAGHIIASGDADTILGNQQVRDVYLGADFRL